MNLPIEMRQAYLQRRRADMVLLEEAAEDGGYEFLIRVAQQFVRNASNYGFPDLEALGKRLDVAATHASSSEVTVVIAEIKHYFNNCSL